MLFRSVYRTGKVDTTPYNNTTTTINENFDLILGGYAIELMTSYKNIGLDTTPSIPLVNFTNPNDISTFTNSKQDTIYRGIDITDFYGSLYKNQNSLYQSKAALATTINTIINQTIMKDLGMMPTIYNIFKLILDDVDTFFRILAATSYQAEYNHHNISEFNKIILNDNRYVDVNHKTTDKHIYSFPLVIDKQPVAGGSGSKEVRVSPVKLSQLLTQPFPELVLVQEFIQTFNNQRRYSEIMNLKDTQNDDGTYKWMPISPLDSKLGSDTKDSAYIGPFYGVDTTGTEINLSTDNRLQQILKIVLDRFYVLSQSSYPTSIYGSDKVSKAYITLYASAEAANLANSANQTKYVNNLSTIAKAYSQDITQFYKYLGDSKNGLLDHYVFDNTEHANIPLSNDNLDSITAYVNKKNPNYVGSIIRETEIKTQVFDSTGASKKPVDVFQNTKLRGFVGNLFLNSTKDFYLFTEENLIYIMDTLVKNNVIATNEFFIIPDGNGTNMNTRYLASYAFNADYSPTKIQTLTKNLKTNISNFLSKGNAYFHDVAFFPKTIADSLNTFDNIINPWISQLSQHDDQIYDTIINVSSPLYNRNLSELMFLSNYGFTLSPFNVYPNKLNSLIYNIAGVMQVPKFLPAYIGLLVLALRNNSDPNSTFNVKTIQDFFTTGAGQNLDSSGFFIFADIHDIDKYLSEQDKENYKKEFDLFNDNQYNLILPEVDTMYHWVKDYIDLNKPIDSIAEKRIRYNIYLNLKSTQNGGTSAGFGYYKILSPLITRTNIINFSEITFSTDDNLVNPKNETLDIYHLKH